MKKRSDVIYVPQALLWSDEWRSLSASAKLLFICLKGEADKDGVTSVRYSRLKDVRGLSSPSTVSKAFSDLASCGWIKRVSPLHSRPPVTVWKLNV